MEYKKKQRKEYIDNSGISVAQSKFVRFLVVGIIVLVLLSSGEVLAQGTSEPTWKLVETRINPGNEPTELIEGTVNKMWAGTFNKYTVEETYFIHKRHVVKYGSLQADCEMRADFTNPPEILVPGETITLTAKVSGTGTSPGIGSNIRFTYRDEGINLRDETSVSTGSGAKPPFSTRSISPYFVVPKTHSGEISIVAFLWNVGAANVRWVYQAQDSTPSEEEEENCEGYCKTIQGANMDRAIWDGVSEYPNCACICEKGWEMTVDGCVACEDICKEKGKHYIYDPDKSYNNACECKCEDGYERSYYNDSCEKVECPPNSTNVADLAGSCPEDRKLNRHCCCNESYIRSWGTCVREDSGEEDYYIKPVVHEIIAGEKIEFSLVKIKHGRDTTVSNDKIEWVVTNEKSISEFIGKITIGTINSNGVFTAKNIGTCFVGAKIDGKIKSKFKMVVKCCQDEEGNLNEIIRLYINSEYQKVSSGMIWTVYHTPTIQNHPMLHNILLIF